MKRLLHTALMYGLPLACLAALAAAVLLFRAPQQAATARPDALVLWIDIELRHAVNELVERFQRRYGIRVETRHETADRLLDMLEQTGQGELMIAGDLSIVNQATHRGFAISTHPVAQRSISTGREVMPGPPAIHAIRLVGGVASDSAPEFMRFLQGSAGEEILRRHGYQTLQE